MFIGPKGDYMQFPALGRLVLVWYGVQSGYAADLRTGAVTRLRNMVVWLDARGHGLLMSYSIAKTKMYHPPTRVFLVKVDALPPLPRCAGSAFRRIGFRAPDTD